MEHSVVFIILGVMTVILGLGPIMGIMNEFGETSSSEPGEEFFMSLTNVVENQCRNMDQYSYVVGESIEGELQGEQIELDDSTMLLKDDEGNEQQSHDLDCSYLIVLDVENQNDDIIDSGHWQALISADTDNAEVTIEAEQ